MITIKTPTQIEGIKKSSQLAAKTLKYLSTFVAPGISTQKLNDLAHQFIVDHGAIPAPLNYNGFPKSICTSVNNVVCHGIPSPDQILKKGDIINLDITTILDGFYGDVSASFPVGKIDKSAQKLIDITKQSLNLSIRSLKPGKILNDCVGKIIQPFVQKHGFSVVRELGGHGVGLKFHEDPFVFHFDIKKDDVILKPGMIFTVEPMINASPNSNITFDKKDGWTVRTFDNSLSAQFEHTVLITDTSYKILTI
ncbi:MAG: type I methionyl aminopeptidase [Candidatus Shapirobacteria bacterium]|nr:type I methionyl aminopeptidase [Candidatus Shapirobacteria bacterium]